MDILEQLNALIAERDRFREHSVQLNNVAWRLAELNGDVLPGDVEKIVNSDVLAELERYAASVGGIIQGLEARLAR